MGMHLIDVHLMGVHLISLCLIILCGKYDPPLMGAYTGALIFDGVLS
jgi:hypothetical protein